MKTLNFNNKLFFNQLSNLLSKRNIESNLKIDRDVSRIIKDVINEGDKAILKYSKKYDKISLKITNLLLSKKIRNSYKNKIDKKTFLSFKKAIINVKKFHELQLPKKYHLFNNEVKITSNWQPLDSVGIYIPGGKAVYPSSLIMNVIPAKVAGVKKIVCVTPPSYKINPYILALLDELKIHEVYQIGGAQAIAALAYGTKTVKKVNKIFGPGNNYVASAKKQVFGKVGIDMIAGPSEIVVVANEKNNPDWVAADLMAQAEHDINSQSILITNNKKFSMQVQISIDKLVKNLPRKKIINKSLSKNGIIILVKDIYSCSSIINYIAPEHLHLHIKEKKNIIKNVSNAGAIFMGEYASEAFGDYIVGSNHVLPTYGSAKFTSGLGVLDFMKRNSIVEMNKKAYMKLSDDVQRMAEIEELESHKLSVKIRQNK